MKPEIVRKIESVLEQIMDYLTCIYPDRSREAIVNSMREQLKTGQSASAYHTIAMQQLSHFRHEIAAIDPAEVYSLFDLLMDAEQRQAILLPKSNREGKSIQSKLEMIRDHYVPVLVRLSSSTQPHGKAGRPSKTPGYDESRAICEYIAEQITKKKVPTLRAQEEAANRWKQSVRMVQRIWQKRDEILDDDESGSDQTT